VVFACGAHSGVFMPLRFELLKVYFLGNYLRYCVSGFHVNTFVVFLSARKADLKKGFQHLVLVLVVLVVGTRVKKGF
jgi:hypothetical protein